MKMLFLFLIVVTTFCNYESFDFNSIKTNTIPSLGTMYVNGIRIRCGDIKIPLYVNKVVEGAMTIPAHIPEMYAANGLILPVKNNRIYFTTDPNRQEISIPVPPHTKIYDRGSFKDYVGCCVLCGLIHHGKFITVHDKIVAKLDEDGNMISINQSNCNHEKLDYSAIPTHSYRVNKCPTYVKMFFGVTSKLLPYSQVDQLILATIQEKAYIEMNNQLIFVPSVFVHGQDVVKNVVHHEDFITINDYIVARKDENGVMKSKYSESCKYK